LTRPAGFSQRPTRHGLRLWDARDLRLLHEIHESITGFAFSPDGERLTFAAGTHGALVSPRGSGQAEQPLLTADTPVRFLAFDALGQHLAVLDDASTVVLIERGSQSEVARFSVRDDGIYSPQAWIRFRPNSPQMLVATSYGTVRVWDPFAGVPVEDVSLPETVGLPSAVSADGTRIAYNGTASWITRKWIQIHDLPTQQIYEIPLNDPAYAVAFSPDGKTVALALEEINLDVEDIHGAQDDLASFLGAWAVWGMKASSHRTTIYLYDIETGRRIRQWRGHTGNVLYHGLDFSPDGNRLVSAGGLRHVAGRADSVGELNVWDLQDTSPSLVLRGHGAPVARVAVSADGQWIASGDTEGEVRVWRPGGHLARSLARAVVLRRVGSPLRIRTASWSSPTACRSSGGTSPPASGFERSAPRMRHRVPKRSTPFAATRREISWLTPRERPCSSLTAVREIRSTRSTSPRPVSPSPPTAGRWR
jgi:WD40 repeat protein